MHPEECGEAGGAVRGQAVAGLVPSAGPAGHGAEPPVQVSFCRPWRHAVLCRRKPQVKKLKSSLTGQFSLTNIRLINLRTPKGMPKRLHLQQHSEDMLHKNL